MASVQSPIRKFIKPFIYQILGPKIYDWFQLKAKIRDIEHRLVEEAEMEFLPKILKSDSVCIDVGANYAYYSVRLAQICKAGTVFAYEPIPSTHAICSKILDHYHLKNVRLFKKGVGNKNETVSFTVPLQDVGTTSAGQAHMSVRNNELEGKDKFHPFKTHATFDCQVVRLDDELKALSRIDFIKIDIEGAEFLAIDGMRNLLQKFKPILLIEVCDFFLKGFGISVSDLEKQVNELGYSFYHYNSDAKTITLSAHANSNGNYFLIHKDKLGELESYVSKKQ